MEKQVIKGNPYFTDTKSKIKQYPYLNENITCDVLIVGAGIDGVIAAHNFAKAGIKTVLIDKGRVGLASTSSATCLLEYQLDEHAHNLTKYMSEQEIVSCYKLGLKSIEIVDDMIKSLGNHCHYSKRPTLIYTLKDNEVEDLHKEYEFRKKHGFNVEFLTPHNNPFDFDFKGGIYCKDGGAEFNPYLFTKQLVEDASQNHNLQVYENTECQSVEYKPNCVKATTSYNYTIKCKKIICATGYNTKLFSKKSLCQLYTSYSIVTSANKNCLWKDRALLHDNENPYHYIRLTHDNRIIMGGEDSLLLFKISNQKALSKYKKLKTYLDTLFVNYDCNTDIEYKFCGMFGVTKNNMGVVGPSINNPNLWFMLSYGANGIINALATSPMLVDLYHHKLDPMLKLFSPDRKIY